MAKAKNVELARAVGDRIKAARESAGMRTRAEFAQALRRDERTVARYENGESLAGVEVLIDVAALCDVSTDWLLLGAERAPAAFQSWLAAQPAERRERDDWARVVRLLRALPLSGWEPTPAFYEQVFLGILGGLLEDMSIDKVVDAARESARHK